nr:hypothetical protein [Moritella viscosa]SHO17745.1 Putative uncharacterized protein [Moritella viscosa]
MTQNKLELVPIKLKEVDNISMGVLPNGETFLSLKGLARFCGVAPSAIIQLSQDWTKGEAQTKTRGKKLIDLIQEWTESIVMAITDYYAHYAQVTKPEAIQNYRKAAKLGLRSYIYDRLGYNKQDLVDESWKLFQERILNNECPKGYFTMFDEATTIIASLIRNDIIVDDSIMPDGSLGIHWAKYWKIQNIESKFGARIQILHKYPDSYRQRDPKINAYPIAALSEFRAWFQDVYLLEKYPTYIKNKTKDGKIALESVSLLLSAVLPPSVSGKLLS